MHSIQYFKNISFLFIINFVIKPIWVFYVERKFQLLLGQETYGNYFSILSIIYIFSVVLDLGLHTYTTKSISENSKTTSQHFYQFLTLKAILIGIYFLLLIVTMYLTCANWTDRILLLTVGISQMLFSVFQFLRTFIQGMQLFKIDSWLSSIDRIFLILLGLLALFLWSNDLTLYHFLGVHILSFVLCIALAMVIIFKYSTPQWFHFNLSALNPIIKSSIPWSIIAILMTIYTRVDGILLKYLLTDGTYHCGVYAFSYRFIDSSYNALYLLSIFLMPFIAFKKASKHISQIKTMVFQSFLIASAMSIGFIIAGYFGAEWLYFKLYKTRDMYSIYTFKYGLLSTLGVGWMYVFGSYLTALGHYRVLIIIVSIGCIINLGSNILLIPQYKALGASISSSIVQLSMGILHGMAAIYYLNKHKTDTI